jgi:hypothetical protein
LTTFTPKKPKQAEDIIESVVPRLSHANPSVVMSTVKVILKFLDYIESVESVKNYCKKLSSSLMTIMMAGPEIQYVLLRSLHAVLQKRPYLLDKDFKFFFVQYNDPIYVKLEKVDILYKLCDSKNFDSVVNELKSYAIMEIDSDLVKRAIRYIGYIGYKFEKSVDLCVESMQEILEHNQDYTVSEGIVVARDLMRKYRGKTLELLKKIDEDFIKLVDDSEAKSAVLFILGEFCTYIKNSTELITPFVENFNEELHSGVKLQILNCVIKNFVNKPDESEDLVKSCLQKGGEESQNPDVRDRAYIYWRLLETNPEIAKEMLTSEKAPFDFTEEANFEKNIVDNIIENMTNVSSVYHKTSSDLVPKDDMILDPNEEKEEDKTQNTGGEEEKQSKPEKKKTKETPIMDADLLGLDEDNVGGHENISNIIKDNNGPMNIFDVIGNLGMTTGVNPTPTKVSMEDFGFVTNDKSLPSNTSNFDESSIKVELFSANEGMTTKIELIYKSSSLTVYSAFNRIGEKILLGLFIINKSNHTLSKFNLQISQNSFGLGGETAISLTSIPAQSGDKIIYKLDIDNNKNDKKPPSCPYKLGIKLTTDLGDIVVSAPLNLNVLFIESGKLANKAFVDFFQANKDNSFNITITYNNLVSIQNEDYLSKIFERNNIFLVAKQNKYDPPLLYYSLNVSGVLPAILECSFLKGQNSLKTRIISGIECITSLIKEISDNTIN